MYCPRCARLCVEKCPRCGRVRGLRAPSENDPVLLVELNVMQSLMVAPVLEESGIPYSRTDRMGWATMGFGSMLESIGFYVPFSALEGARRHLESVFDEAGDILSALRTYDPQGE